MALTIEQAALKADPKLSYVYASVPLAEPLKELK